jgi:VCBS repeat-containing protein
MDRQFTAWERLESRSLLAVAPVAVDDSFTVDEDTFLLAGDAASAWSAAIQQSQPLHWWRFEEPAGGIIRDEGSAHIDGTLGGGVTLDRPGAVGRAAYFDSTGFVRIGEAPIQNDWSVESIVSVELNHGHAQSLLGAASAELAGGNAVAIRVVQWPQLESLGYTQYGVLDWDTGIPSPTQLAHVAWVGTSSGVDIYVDGTLAVHMDASVPLSRYVIGAGHLDESGPFANDPLLGLIDELAVYSRALTAQEVAQHAQAMQTTANGNSQVADGVLINDTDADGDPLTATVVSAPTHGELTLRPNGGFYYAPLTDFHGTDQFTYRVSDGTLQSNVATVTISVNSVNDAPVAADDRGYQVANNAVLNAPAATGVLTNDTDVDGNPLTASLVTSAVSGTVDLRPDGSFTYTPREGWVGRDVFTYRVSDGTADSEIARVSIRVLRGNSNSAPAKDDYYTVGEDQALDVDTNPWLSTSKVPLQIVSLAYDAVGDRLLAAVPPGAGPLGGTLTTINPYTGELGQSLPLPGNLDTVVVSDDGQTIHVAIEDAHAVQIIDAVTMTLGPTIRFPSPSIVARQVLAVPGDSDAVLIVAWDNSISQPAGTFIYDNGVARPNGGGGVLMSFDETGEHVYGYENWLTSFYFWEHEVDETGMRVTEEHPWGSMLYGFIDGFQYAAGHLFVSGGGIVDIETREGVARFDGPWIYRASGLENTLFTFDDAAQRFHAYDLTTFQKRASIAIPSVGPVHHLLTRFGEDGLALFNNSEVVLVRSDEMFGITQRGVLRNDVLAGQTSPIVKLVDGTEHGDLELRPDGTFHYQPTANYHGPDSFGYSYVDGNGVEQTATAHITVSSMNDAPVAAEDQYVLPASGPLTVDATAGVLANDSDVADGDPLAAVIVQRPKSGTVSLRADGSFTYRPNASFVLSDSFTYQAFDGTDLSEVQTVSVRLNVPTIDVGAHVLKANAPNQRLDIFVTGGQLVSGIDLFAQVGDGGPETTSLGLPPGQDGPSIARVELKENTIFATVPDAAADLGSLPQLANWSISITGGGGVPATGRLATLVVDTTGFFEGKWDLSLAGALPAHPLGPLDTRFANMLAFITNGSIEIIPAKVMARHVFYNNSAWDGDNTSANSADDLAIANDKQPLLPGEMAGYANYTNFSRGINGVMVDVVGLPTDTTLVPSDFEFRVGRQYDVAAWSAAPPPTITTRRGAGANGADRVTLIWPDGAVQNTWLEVRFKSGARSLLGHDDVFYFGNAIGETGSMPGNTFVTSVDVIGARDNQRGPFDLAPIDDVYDFNRDRLVTSADVIIARDHQAGALTAIPLIAAPPAAIAATAAAVPASADTAWQSEPLPQSLFPHAVRPIGDVNGDGRFDTSDLVEVFQRGKYLVSQVTRDATWADGDWDGDGDFDDDDLLMVLATANLNSSLS